MLKTLIRITFFLLSLSVISIFLILFSGYIGALRPETYLPDDYPESENPEMKSTGNKNIEIRNSWFIFMINDYGEVNVMTSEGEPILSSLTYYLAYDLIKDHWGLKHISVSLLNDSTASVIGDVHEKVKVSITYTVNKKLARIDVHVRTFYKSDITVSREALVAKFDVPVSEVYLKNGRVENESFDREYWLQRRGVRFGYGLRSAMIYHTPYISSMQLDVVRSLLYLNLEYFPDHPYVHIPYQEDGGGRWEDQSMAEYSAGTESENSFSIYFGALPQETPRLMLVPNGNIAGYIFTEHADGNNIRTHRAAYFGSEKITKIENATGGFVAHKIPVTKSVFYSDSAGSLSNSVSNDYKGNDDLLDFLDQLNSTGLYDICLHTPENLNSNRQILEESIKFMKERFGTTTWIDHGMYNGLINRESFVCDGLDPKSAFFAADLWEKYGTLYFWNPAVEIIRGASTVYVTKEIRKLRLYNASVTLWKHYLSSEDLDRLGFLKAFMELLRRYPEKQEMNSLCTNRGNAFPTPLFWQHPTRTIRFYSWATDYAKVYNTGIADRTAKQVFNNERKQLDRLLNNWGVFIEHGYYIRASKVDNEILSLDKGTYVINPVFEAFLTLLDQYRGKGDLYICTVRDLLDYWILLQNLQFEYLPDNEIIITNCKDTSIKGLSFAVKSDIILVDGKVPASRQIGNDRIVWFDLPPNGKVRMKIIPD